MEKQNLAFYVRLTDFYDENGKSQNLIEVGAGSIHYEDNSRSKMQKHFMWFLEWNALTGLP